MRNPYLIDGPAVISFSGGRSSAYMLFKIIEAHGGVLPNDVVVLFSNTGKEEEATLLFVRECGRRWGVQIVWLEYESAERQRERWRVVDFDSASRNGEPLEKVFCDRKFLPNPVARICTEYGKIKPMKYFAQDVLGFDDWRVVIGFRADEQKRVAKLSNSQKEPYERVAPMAEAGVSALDVADFWQRMDFDLNLPNHAGVTPNGNCDLCFLKGAGRIFSLICEKPERALWWIKQESTGNTFRKDRPNYLAMYRAAVGQSEMFGFDVSCDVGECSCTD